MIPPTDAQTDTHMKAQPFNLRNYGLNDMQIRFVEEYLRSEQDRCIQAGWLQRRRQYTAYVNASRLLRNARSQQSATRWTNARRVKITQDEVEMVVGHCDGSNATPD